jgi:hypothetical protein
MAKNIAGIIRIIFCPDVGWSFHLKLAAALKHNSFSIDVEVIAED